MTARVFISSKGIEIHYYEAGYQHLPAFIQTGITHIEIVTDETSSDNKDKNLQYSKK